MYFLEKEILNIFSCHLTVFEGAQSKNEKKIDYFKLYLGDLLISKVMSQFFKSS